MPEKRGNSDVGGVKALASLPLPTAVLLSVFSGLRAGPVQGRKAPPPGSKGCVPSPTLLQVSKYLLIKLNALSAKSLRTTAVQ